LAPIQVEGWGGEEILLVEILGVKDPPVVTPRQIIPKRLPGVVTIGDIFEGGAELVGGVIAP
jgi:hypothetical protein